MHMMDDTSKRCSSILTQSRLTPSERPSEARAMMQTTSSSKGVKRNDPAMAAAAPTPISGRRRVAASSLGSRTRRHTSVPPARTEGARLTDRAIWLFTCCQRDARFGSFQFFFLSRRRFPFRANAIVVDFISRFEKLMNHKKYICKIKII